MNANIQPFDPDYWDFVEKESQPDSNLIFGNHAPDHVKVSIEFLFRRAKKNVCVLAHRLEDGIYDSPDVVREAVSFLKRDPNARLEIITETFVDMENALLQSIRANNLEKQAALYYAAWVKMPGAHLSLHKRWWNFKLKRICDQNFIVVDALHARHPFSRHDKFALIRFNSPESGKSMVELFETVKSISTRVPFPAPNRTALPAFTPTPT